MALGGQASAHVYSLSRPLHPLMPQTKQFRDLEEYAYQHSIQVLLPAGSVACNVAVQCTCSGALPRRICAQAHSLCRIAVLRSGNKVSMPPANGSMHWKQFHKQHLVFDCYAGCRTPYMRSAQGAVFADSSSDCRRSSMRRCRSCSRSVRRIRFALW